MKNKDLPLVSIITPSYNQGQFLEETILSILNQDYPNLEYIVVDGGSSDNSPEIIKKYEKRLAWWVSEKDNGQTEAIIKGFERAKGQYMTWICSDDLLEPSAISMAVAYHLKHAEVACTFGIRTRIDNKGNLYGVQYSPKFRNWFLKCGMTLPQETTLFRRDVYEEVGGLDASLEMAMDFDLWCKIAKKHKIEYIPSFLGRFRAHENNKSTIFSQQEKESGLTSGYPAEFAMVYKRHFGCDLPKWKRKYSGKLKSFLYYLEKIF